MDAELARNGNYQRLKFLLMDAAGSTPLRKEKAFPDPESITKKLEEMVLAEEFQINMFNSVGSSTILKKRSK